MSPTVAHDLNNHLAAIENFALFVHEALAEAVAEGHAEWAQALRDIEQVQEAATQASAVVNQ